MPQQGNGLTVVDEEYYAEGTTDFTSFVTKLLAEIRMPLFLGGAPTGDCAVIIKEARDQGLQRCDI